MQLSNSATFSAQDAISAFFRVALDEVLGLPNSTIQAQQEVQAPFPPGQVQTVEIMSTDTRGTPDYKNVDLAVDIDSESQQFVTSTVSINLYRGEADYRARVFRAWLSSQNSVMELKRAGLGLINVSPIRSVGAAIPESWERRAQFDVRINHVDSYKEVVKEIQNLTINGVYYGNSVIKNLNVTT